MKRAYVLRQPVDVMEELERSPFLAPLLLEAHGKIREYFPSAACSLEMFRDSDEEETAWLALHIGIPCPPGGALERLWEFDEGWWNEAMERAEGRLSIDLEYL